MDERLYLENGYLDAAWIYDLPVRHIWVIGGRGTGKTYGFLREALRRKNKFMFLRRTETQVDIIRQPAFSPFSPINADEGYNVQPFPYAPKISAFYHAVENEDTMKLEPSGAPIGYLAAVKTFHNVRGFSARDVDLIYFDEFVREPTERRIKGEPAALWNALETINRNRELEGLPSAKFIACSNAEDIANDYFVDLGLVTVAEKMVIKGESVKVLRDREMAIVILQGSPISEAKADTALYKMTKGTGFAQMALDNSFRVDFDAYRSRPIGEYRPVVTVGELTVYKHKSNGRYYVTPHRAGNPPVYTMSDADQRRFKVTHRWLAAAYMRGIIDFESYFCESLLYKYLDMR